MPVNPHYGTDNASHDVAEPHNGIEPQNGNPRHDEESPLLARPDSSGPKVKALTGVGTIVAVLLLGRVLNLIACGIALTFLPLGEFISNADATLVMAAAGRLSSEFNRLQDASWLSTGYTLGLCAAQPMVSSEGYTL